MTRTKGEKGRKLIEKKEHLILWCGVMSGLASHKRSFEVNGSAWGNGEDGRIF